MFINLKWSSTYVDNFRCIKRKFESLEHLSHFNNGYKSTEHGHVVFLPQIANELSGSNILLLSGISWACPLIAFFWNFWRLPYSSTAFFQSPLPPLLNERLFPVIDFLYKYAKKGRHFSGKLGSLLDSLLFIEQTFVFGNSFPHVYIRLISWRLKDHSRTNIRVA